MWMKGLNQGPTQQMKWFVKRIRTNILDGDSSGRLIGLWKHVDWGNQTCYSSESLLVPLCCRPYFLSNLGWKIGWCVVDLYKIPLWSSAVIEPVLSQLLRLVRWQCCPPPVWTPLHFHCLRFKDTKSVDALMSVIRSVNLTSSVSSSIYSLYSCDGANDRWQLLLYSEAPARMPIKFPQHWLTVNNCEYNLN